MSRKHEHIDEHILAAYLSSDLPASLRREIAAYIAEREDAIDLLAMANEALSVTDSGDGSYRAKPERPARTLSARRSEFLSSRSDAEKSLWKVTAVFASAVLLLAITVAILVISNSSVATVSTSRLWSPFVSSETTQIGWPVQAGAAEYHVVLQEVDSGQSEVLHQTQSTTFVLNRELLQLAMSEEYNLWVLSIDVRGEIISRSAALPIRIGS